MTDFRSVRFNFLEFFVVVFLVGLFATGLVWVFLPGRRMMTVRDTQRKVDLVGVARAVQMYAVDHAGSLPAEIGQEPGYLGQAPGLVRLDDDLVPDYLERVPYDPVTGTPTNTQFMIWTQGGRVYLEAMSEIHEGERIRVVQ